MSTIKVNALRHTGGSSDNISLDSSGRVLVGTSTAQGNNRLQLEGSASGAGEWSGISLRRGVATASLTSGQYLGAISFQSQGGAEGGVLRAVCDANWSASSHPTRLTFETTASSSTSPTERMRITPDGDLRFNSGYGSVATAYGVRAWVNFNGSGTIAIRDDGNVSSLTDNGIGDYTISFTNSMPDKNYAIGGSVGQYDQGGSDSVTTCFRPTLHNTGSLRISVNGDSPGLYDYSDISVIILR